MGVDGFWIDVQKLRQSFKFMKNKQVKSHG